MSASPGSTRSAQQRPPSVPDFDPPESDLPGVEPVHPHGEREPVLGITSAQVAGSALGAVSAAVASSFFGVAGTLIGAALVSVVATVGTAAYTRSLQRTAEAVRRGVPRSPQGRQRVVRAARRSTWRSLPWPRLAGAAGLVLVLSLGTITVIEALSGQPLSTTVGSADSDSGTTVTGGSDGGSEEDTVEQPAEESPAPDPSVSPTPTDGGSPSSEPSSEPSAEPSAEPSGPPDATSTAPVDPTADSTGQPSVGPTDSPSEDPAAQPTATEDPAAGAGLGPEDTLG